MRTAAPALVLALALAGAAAAQDGADDTYTRIVGEQQDLRARQLEKVHSAIPRVMERIEGRTPVPGAGDVVPPTRREKTDDGFPWFTAALAAAVLALAVVTWRKRR